MRKYDVRINQISDTIFSLELRKIPTLLGFEVIRTKKEEWINVDDRLYTYSKCNIQEAFADLVEQYNGVVFGTYSKCYYLSSDSDYKCKFNLIIE